MVPWSLNPLCSPAQKLRLTRHADFRQGLRHWLIKQPSDEQATLLHKYHSRPLNCHSSHTLVALLTKPRGIPPTYLLKSNRKSLEQCALNNQTQCLSLEGKALIILMTLCALHSMNDLYPLFTTAFDHCWILILTSPQRHHQDHLRHHPTTPWCLPGAWLQRRFPH